MLFVASLVILLLVESLLLDAGTTKRERMLFSRFRQENPRRLDCTVLQICFRCAGCGRRLQSFRYAPRAVAGEPLRFRLARCADLASREREVSALEARRACRRTDPAPARLPRRQFAATLLRLSTSVLPSSLLRDLSQA